MMFRAFFPFVYPFSLRTRILSPLAHWAIQYISCTTQAWRPALHCFLLRLGSVADSIDILFVSLSLSLSLSRGLIVCTPRGSRLEMHDPINFAVAIACTVCNQSHTAPPFRSARRE